MPPVDYAGHKPSASSLANKLDKADPPVKPDHIDRPTEPAKPAKPAAKPKPAWTPPGREVHEQLQEQPQQRDAVYRQLMRTDPGLIYHLERWQAEDIGTPVPSADRAEHRVQFQQGQPGKPSDPVIEQIQGQKETLDTLSERAAAGGPGADAVAQQDQALRESVAAALNTAATAEPRYPGDPLTAEQRMAGRAAQIKALAPGDAAFVELVDQVQVQVTTERTAKASAEEVQRVHQEQGAVAAAETLDRLTAAHPEAAASIIEAAGPTIDEIAQGLSTTTSSSRDDLDRGVAALSAAAERGGAASAEQIGAELERAFVDHDIGVYAVGPRGNPAASGYATLHTALQAAVAGGHGASLAVATVDALRAAGRTEAAAKVEQALVGGVDQLRESHESIQQQYTEREVQLQRELATFGPGLTAEERQAYEAAYWADETTIPANDQGDLPSNAEVRRRFDASDDQLAATLEAATPTLERLALAGDENAGEVLLDAYESLAKSPAQADQALQWAQRLENNPALFEQIDGFIDADLAVRLRDGLKAEGVKSAASQLLVDMAAAQTPQEREALLDQFIDMVRALDESGAYLDDIQNITELRENYREYRELMALPAGDPRRAGLDSLNGRMAANAEALVGGWEDLDNFGKSLAMVGLVVGLADTGQAIGEGDLPEAVLAAIGASKDAAEIGIGILGVIGDGGRVASLDAARLGLDAADVGRFAAGAADFGARFLPLVGFGLDAIQLEGDIQSLRHNPNAGEVVATLGTVVSLVGDVAEVVPYAGTLVGGALGAIGSLVHGVGGFIDGLIEGDGARQAMEERQRAYLEAAGLDATTAANFVREPYLISLAENFAMPPEAVQALVNAQADHPPEERERLLMIASDTAAAFGLTGQRAADFFQDVLSSPNAAALDEWTDFFAINREGYRLHAMGQGSPEGDFYLQQMRQEQSNWFAQYMPDVYTSYLAPIPGAPPYAQPGGAGAVNGYFDDLVTLYTSPSGTSISGTAPNGD